MTLQNNDAASVAKKCDQELLASDVLTQRIVELEHSLNQYKKKYKKSRIALAGMEEALLVREIV